MKKLLWSVSVALLAVALAAPLAAAEGKVSARIETVVIPTFTIDKGSPVPQIFAEDWYAAYPRTMLDVTTRSKEPTDKEYEMSVLENSLIRVEVLGAVGGRVWRIIDKKTGENLLWTNDSVKPIRVGRRSGWLAGGIEFPFPVGNHGEDTMEPYRTQLKENEDGSATVTVSSFDHFYRFWGSYDITVRPDDARMAVTVRLYNPTLVRNRYQIWINAAVKTGDDMQFVFPVDWVAGHGFGGIYPWPMWDDGKYDRSMWKNQESQLGVFGWNADYLGAYFHEKDYGIIRYCNHNMAEGIKLWTWGHESHWTEEYSINSGSYNEIQGGRWPTQEMYGWLEPHQMDTWTEYWYPVSGTGGVDAASKEAALGVAVSKDGDAFVSATVKVNFVTPFDGRMVVGSGETVLAERELKAAAGDLVSETVSLAGLTGENRLSVSLVDAQGFVVADYDRALTPVAGEKPEIPKSVRVQGTGPVWEKYETALGREVNEGDFTAAADAYRAITKQAEDFAPAWKALGILLYKQIDSEGALEALSEAARLAPEDMEALYYLGLVKLDLAHEDALDTLGRVEGDIRFSHLAQFVRGVEGLKAGKYEEAAAIFKAAGDGWSRDAVLWDYAAVAARRAGDAGGASEALTAAFAAEPLNAFAMVERLTQDGTLSEESIRAALGADSDLYMETALFYDAINEGATALTVAKAGLEMAPSGLYLYQLAYLATRAGDESLAQEYAARGDETGTDYVFPHRREDYRVLDTAAASDGQVGYAKYHQGTLLYWLGRKDDALGIWVSLLGKYDLPGLYRKVADAYTSGKLSRDYASAIEMYSKALEEDADDAQIYYSLDDLYEQVHDNRARGEILKQGRARLGDDDMMALRMARYMSNRGRYGQALEILTTHEFKRAHQSWELMYIGRQALEDTYMGMASDALKDGDKEKALEYLGEAGKARETLQKWFD